MGWKKQYNNHDDILTKRLLLSCADGNLRAVQNCLDSGTDLHCTEPELGWTPLHVACYRQNAAIVELLLDEGANPNICANDGYAPLRLIVVGSNRHPHEEDEDEDFEHDCCRIAEALLQHGADPWGCVDARSVSSPLHVAAQNGQLHMVELLVEYGAFFHVQPTLSGEKQSSHAKEALDTDDSAGSDPVEEAMSMTPLAIACRRGHGHVVDYLLHNVMPPTIVLGDTELMLPFREACHNYHVDCIVQLLRYGLEIMYENNDDKVDIVVESLLEIVLDPQVKNHEEEENHFEGEELGHVKQLKNDAFKMALFREACRSHMVDVIVPLLPHMEPTAVDEYEEEDEHEDDALTNGSSEFGDTTLGSDRRPRSLKATLVRAVDPNNNQTVLHRMCAKKNIGWVEKLLELARDQGDEMEFDEEAYDEHDYEEGIVANAMSVSVIDRLVNAVDMDLQTALHWACRADFVEGVRSLLECPHVSVNAEDINGNTPLMLAEGEDVARCLLSMQTDPARLTDLVNQSNSQTGQTRLHTASFQGNHDMCQVLLQFGADPNAGDVRGCTALYFASARGFSQICLHLMAHGADPNVAAADIATNGVCASLVYGPLTNDVIGGDTPMHAACRGGHLSVVFRLFSADVHAVNARGRTPLHEACEQGHLKVVEYLVRERRARLDVTDLPEGGFTPFELACHAERQDVMYYLLRHKAVEEKPDGLTPYISGTYHVGLNQSERSFGRSFGVVPDFDNVDGWGEEGSIYGKGESSYNTSAVVLGKFLGDPSWGGDEGVSCCGRTESSCTTAEDTTAVIQGERDGLGTINKVLETELTWEFWKNYYSEA